MDVLEAGPESVDAPTGAGPSAPSPQGVTPPPPTGGILRIYARDNDTRIRLISDETSVPDADRLADIAFFSTPQEAAAVATWCADLLAKSRKAAGEGGWHLYPADHLPALLNVARNHLNVTIDPVETAPTPSPSPQGRDAALPEGAKLVMAPTAASASPPRAWTRERIARLAFLAGQGWTAKQIAADPLVMSTPNNVQRQANRFGILLSDGPQGQVTFQLPIATTAVIDRAAAAVNLTRKSFLRQWLIRGAGDPARYGMIVVSS